MPRQEDIRNTIWQDIDVDELSNEAMLLFLWSWTNERCGMSGLYRCPRPLLCEGRLAGEVLDVALKECEDARRLRYEKGVLWSVTRVKRLPWKTSQTAKAIADELAEIDSDNPIYSEFVQRYDGLPWGKKGEARLSLTQGSPDPQPSLNRGSAEPRPSLENPDVEPSDRPSPDPHPRVTGKGNGNGSGKGKGKGKSSQGSTASVSAVADAPESLDDVFEILGRISEIRGVAFASLERVAAAIASYPDADHVAVASDMEDWLCNSEHGKRTQIRDVVQTYRNQLQRKATGSPAGEAAAGESFAEYDEAVVHSG
jgi:hypothetical protein